MDTDHMNSEGKTANKVAYLTFTDDDAYDDATNNLIKENSVALSQSSNGDLANSPGCTSQHPGFIFKKNYLKITIF